MKNEQDLSRYFAALEAFRREHPDEVKKFWKSEKAFDKMLAQFRRNEKQMVRDIQKSFGSVGEYTDQMAANLSHLSEVVDEMMSGGSKGCEPGEREGE